MKRNFVRSTAGVVLASASSLALAVAPDMTTVTTAITDASSAIATVGAAVLVMIVGAKVYKWIRRAL